MDNVKNILMQIFVFLPLSVIESGAGTLLIVSIYYFSNQFKISEDYLFIILFIISLSILIGLFFLERFLRGFDGLGFSLFFFITMPARFVFQIFTIFFTILSCFCEKIWADYEFDCFTVPECFSYVVFGCMFDLGFSDSSQSGERGIRMRNFCMQLFVLFPVAAAQFVLSKIAFNLMSTAGGPNENQLWVLWLILIFFGLLILSIISTKLRGHIPTDEYFDNKFVYTKKDDGEYLTDAELTEKIENSYRYNPRTTAPEISGYKNESGGWTTFLRPVTILCFLSSSFLVFTQIISILLALIINPCKGRVFSWYGQIDYSQCNCVFLQKLLHFYFGFVIFAY